MTESECEDVGERQKEGEKEREREKMSRCEDDMPDVRIRSCEDAKMICADVMM